MPTRKITRSPVKVTGTVPDGQKFESSLEEDFFILLRFNRLVASYEHQPITLEWQDATDKIRNYTPDALVHYRTDLPEAADMIPMLCEVKPDLTEGSKTSRRYKPPRKEDEAENLLKWAAAERYASNHGWGFKVYRESEIRTPFLDNARFLLPDIALEQRLLAALKASGTLSLGDWAGTASSTIMERAQVLPACYWLIGTSLNSNVRPIPRLVYAPSSDGLSAPVPFNPMTWRGTDDFVSPVCCARLLNASVLAV